MSSTDEPTDTLGGLPLGLRADLRRLAEIPNLLVALDFDGTLAPEVDDPEQARALPAARDAVLKLIDVPGTRVALVSGRAVDSLVRVAQLPDSVLLAGSHGVEIRLDHAGDTIALNEEEEAQREALSVILHGVAQNFDNVWIERKPAGFALHTRLASEEDSRIAHLEALAHTKDEISGLTVREGKNVLEFSVRTATKGEAVEHLRRYTKADAVFYAGDDVTDEDAFRALGPVDLGVKSGPGVTAADFRVEGPSEIARVLRMLAEYRSNQEAVDS
ncbi:trehalose-phosphatase [Plantibacter sp. Mn2098]|uniref:trehalose-phosphatase n=1 Tax=Plantibacter sp. Mn2098 TaxID=3395266 RepID=UPI003BEE6395